MSFGRRLALFFVLIALLPTLALLAILVIVNEDSRSGKADARLAAGLETAAALYEEAINSARTEADEFAASRRLGSALVAGDRGALQRFATEELRARDLVAIEMLGPARTPVARAGSEDAVAFSVLVLTNRGEPSGTLRVSTTTAPDFAAELRRLTNRELVLSRDSAPLTATVPASADAVEVGEGADLEVGETEYRARHVELAAGETLLLLGPRKEGGLFSVDRPAATLLIAFLLLGVVFAYALARTLTGLHARVSEQAITDPLTGLWNRRRMDQLLVREVDRAQRFGHEISLLIVDIDDFKATNDRLGHPAGDAVLREVSSAVRENTRSIDLSARYGGDELALILVETGVEGARVVAERLRSQVSAREVEVLHGPPLRTTVSIGAATIPASATSAEELLDAADQALLRAKRAGKNKLRSAPGGAKSRARSA